MNFSIAIPTYKREKDLSNCLNSILDQSLLPSEIILVDDDSLGFDFIEKNKNQFEEKDIEFVYYNKIKNNKKRGSSESRNIGFSLTSNEINFILDDDLILEKDFFENIMITWENNKNDDLIGVGGFIKNNRRTGKIERIYNKIFGLTSKYKWDVNSVGFQVWDESINNEEKCFYTHGGVCSYKKDLVNKLGGFSTFSGGRTALEDVDFCLRAKDSGYHFIINPNAKVIHKQSKASRESDYLMGIKESYNRRIIFKNNCKNDILNKIKFVWANIGWVLRQFLVGNFSKGLGMIKGLIIN